MKVYDALVIHARAYKALDLPDHTGIPDAKRGTAFIGLATGILFAQRYPERAEQLLTAMTLMRDTALGNDRLWEDLVAALADVVPVRLMLDGSPCWCVSADEPHEGWVHAPACETLRAAA